MWSLPLNCIYTQGLTNKQYSFHTIRGERNEFHLCISFPFNGIKWIFDIEKSISNYIREKKNIVIMLLAILPSPRGTEITRFPFNSSQAAEIIVLLHSLLILPYGLAVQRSVTSVVERPLCQTSNSVPNFLLTFSILGLVFSHNPLSSWHLAPSTSCSHCLYSFSASFCQTPHESDVCSAGQIFSAC